MSNGGGGAGKVYLVGAGPGDPRLITVKGLALLRACDVVVYDSLINAALLDETPEGCVHTPIGGAGGAKALTQEEINQLLIHHARAGRSVVRLKGGDPFIFGRGGEEAETLAEAGIDFEIVPGVSSAAAAAAYAGIPLTHRALGSAFAVLTGHRADETDAIPWSELARAVPTLVFLMSMRTLPAIVAQLLHHGLAADTPAAVVHWGCTARQMTVVDRLDCLVGAVEAAGVGSPAVAIVGKVVQLRQKIQWFERLPLFGTTVVVTRARRQASELEHLCLALGADVTRCPTVRVEPRTDWEAIDAEVGDLAGYGWAVFTSANAVDCFWQWLGARGKDSRALAGMRIVAVGAATAAALAGKGITADLVPSEYRQEGIAEMLTLYDLRGERVLLPGAEQMRSLLSEALRARGASVRATALYRTVPDARAEDAERVQQAVDRGRCVLSFASSSAVRNFVAVMGEGWPARYATRVTVACIGPLTRKTAEEVGFRVAVEPATATIPALVEALVRYVADTLR